MKMKAKKGKDHIKKNRKQLRKEQRYEKKARKNEFYSKRKKQDGKFVRKPTDNSDEEEVDLPQSKSQTHSQIISSTEQASKIVQKEKKHMLELQRQMKKRRKKQMVEANIEESKNIKKLEKQLKLNKRRSKNIPKSFASDGLDYLLEVCDGDNLKDIVNAEMGFNDNENDFDDDFALMTGKNKREKDLKDNNSQKNSSKKRKLSIYEEEYSDASDDDDNSEYFNSEEEDDKPFNSEEETEEPLNSEEEAEEKELINLEDEEEPINSEEEEEPINSGEDEEEPINSEELASEEEQKPQNQSLAEENSDNEREELAKETWHDIYGRLRDKKGNIITEQESSGKYIPPAVRAQQLNTTSAKLIQLKRQIKGLINRLAESNMYSIANQIESLYMKNSRNDMNETLTNLILDSLISNVTCPERLLLEHVLLIAILHANVGCEVGAHFLQVCAQKFNQIFQKEHRDVEDKTLDNLVNVLSQLYNYKIVGSALLYDIITKLSLQFEEKHVECILNILRSVGFTLRKEDPLVLKNVIGDLQKKASSEDCSDNPRVKFMLEILLAIKNNNVNKIPNYDTSYSERLKKISKGFIRKGNYVTQLNIGLEDLLKADERGKWWVVGSAWTGKDSTETHKSAEKQTGSEFSQKLLDLARKQRMNTDTRRNIFCILMSAEDFEDAFENLLRLGLKNQQEREIINVILHCCLGEKNYNPYYSFLAQKFCDYDRRFQMIIKYSIWDKVKALGECSSMQMTNLAKLLTHLFLEKGLPISTLKIVQFSDLDKISVRFLRLIFLGILLSEDQEQCLEVFARVPTTSDKTKMFRESLRLFIHHFLLRNLSTDSIDENEREMLIERAKTIDKMLSGKNNFIALNS